MSKALIIMINLVLLQFFSLKLGFFCIANKSHFPSILSSEYLHRSLGIEFVFQMTNYMKSSLNKLIHFSWINSMFSSPVVKSSDPLPEVHNSSFVSCARLSISDIEMGWVDVDEPSSTSEIDLPTTSKFPTRSNYQLDRTVSSSSSLRVSFTMAEMDFVMVETTIPLFTPSSSFPTPPLNLMNASTFASSSSFSSTRSSIPPLQSSNLGWVAVEEPSSTSETELPTTSQFHTRSSSFPTPPLNHMNASRSFASSSSFSSTRSSPPPSQSSNLVTIPSPSSSLVPSPSIVTSSPPSSSSSALPQDHNSFSSRNSVSLSTSLSSASSNQHSDDSTSLSGFPVSASTRPQRSCRAKTIFITHTSFRWQEVLLAISFTVPVGLLSTTFKPVDGILVPDVLFTSNPALFYIFIILDAVAFTASVIGILIHALKKNKYLYCLSLLAFTALVVAFAIYLWVLLPDFLRFIPYVVLIAILLALLHVSVSLYKRTTSSKFPRQLQPLVAATSS